MHLQLVALITFGLVVQLDISSLHRGKRQRTHQEQFGFDGFDRLGDGNLRPRVPFRHHRKKYLKLRMAYYANSASTFNPILLCGDVSENPGPHPGGRDEDKNGHNANSKIIASSPVGKRM